MLKVKKIEKLKKFFKYLLLVLLWSGVVAYIAFAVVWVRARRAEQRVERLTIRITDSSSGGHLVTSKQVREWLSRSGLQTIGEPVSRVDLLGIERLVQRNGFVDRVKAYITYQGELRISISQRRPVVRFIADGYDCYVTSDGYIFPVPHTSSVYVSVVTGAYKPPFPPTYSGPVKAYMDKQYKLIDQRIALIDKEKYPFYRREIENDQNIRALRRMRAKKGWFESDELFDKRAQEVRKERELLRRRYRYEDGLLEQGIARVEQKQQHVRREQKKLEKNYEDFTKLITFVEYIENDDFWRSEVVQIVASASVSGALEVAIIPRSGDHVVLFGRLEQMEQKFDKLLRFYRGGLNKIGWDTYRTIDIRYADQVVCKK